MAPFFEQKHKLWIAAGLNSTSTVSLTLTDPLPRSVLRYLRIQRLNETDLAAVGTRQNDAAFEKISDSNEREVLNFLVESISALLDGFTLQLEQLEEQLEAGLYTPAENTWLAAHVSLGEQRVLRLARKTAEASLAAVVERGNVSSSSSTAAQCANCNKILTQVMRCGRCNKVMYCGRSCQVAHYKQHKANCRATVP